MNLFQQSESQIERSSVNFFAIYDPLLLQDESAQHILIYITKTEVDEHSKIRRIGLIEGLRTFNKNFTNDELEYLELDDSKVAVLAYDGLVFIMGIKLTKILNNDDEADYESEVGTEYINDLAPLPYIRAELKQGFEDFQLLCRGFEERGNHEAWWGNWIDNFQLQLCGNGFLKLYDAVRVSREHMNTMHLIDEFKESTAFNQLWILDLDKQDYSNYGLLYSYDQSIPESRVLFNWIARNDEYGFRYINENNIIQKPTDEEELNTEYVYDPFKLAYNTISGISNMTGITTGVTVGYQTIKSMSSYLPSWVAGFDGKSRHINNDEDAENKNDLVVSRVIYLNKTGFKMILYRHLRYLLVTIYEDLNTVLDDSQVWLLKKIGYEIPNNLTKLHDKPLDFYYNIHDCETNTIKANFPNIPRHEDQDEQEFRFFYDLSISKLQSTILNREIIKHQTQISHNSNNKQVEKLVKIKNGWWVYQLKHKSKDILIAKKWLNSDTNRPKRLDKSTVDATIGKNAKKWLGEVLNERTTDNDGTVRYMS